MLARSGMDRWLRQLTLRASVGAERLGRTTDTRIFSIQLCLSTKFQRDSDVSI
jgi:hypothetical protein